uniref:N-acetylgalactosaminide beta-1,3-galactosyltransferase n=1 Tax=Strongyloides venezuelensis TaxID=75913 RepID=A0A0K0F4Q4_STRVS
MLKLSNLIIIFIYFFYLVNSIKTVLIDENDKTLKSEEYDMFQKSYNNSVFEGISQKLQKNIRIFCVILTSPKFKSSKCIPQKNTWLKRCNGYVFASSKDDPTLPSIESFPKDEYKYSFGKVKNALRWVWKNHKNDYDYVLKADDDTYFVMENLRAFLINENPNNHSYLGFTIYNPPGNVANGYIQGGSGYVFSKKTFNTLVEKGLSNRKYCTQRNDVFDDKEIGKCLFRMGILPTFLSDDRHRFVFNPELLSFVLAKKKTVMNFYKELSLFQPKRGMDSFSDFPIAFHRVKLNLMYFLEYLFYHAQVIGKNSRLFRMEDNDTDDRDEKIEKRLDLIKKFSKYNYKKIIVKRKRKVKQL